LILSFTFLPLLLPSLLLQQQQQHQQTQLLLLLLFFCPISLLLPLLAGWLQGRVVSSLVASKAEAMRWQAGSQGGMQATRAGSFLSKTLINKRNKEFQNT
jgi:hypothetical protein